IPKPPPRLPQRDLERGQLGSGCPELRCRQEGERVILSPKTKTLATSVAGVFVFLPFWWLPLSGMTVTFRSDNHQLIPPRTHLPPQPREKSLLPMPAQNRAHRVRAPCLHARY